MNRQSHPRLPTLDARETVLLIGLCEWLIDALWCTLDMTVDVVHDADSIASSATDEAATGSVEDTHPF